MLAKAKNIIGAKTKTKSGQYLGRVADFEINIISQQITKYYIQSDILGFLKDYLIINASQVISFKNKQLIVEDAALPEKQTKQTAADIEYVK